LVLTETVKPAGVGRLAGDTLSQEFPKVTDALTVVDPEVVPIFNVWELGGVPPRV
jgi:hypothetical protein